MACARSSVSYSAEGEDCGCEGEEEAKWCSIMACTSSSSSERPSWICMHRETPSAMVTHCRGCTTARGTGRGGGEGGKSGGEGGGSGGEHAPKRPHSEPYWLTNAALSDHAQRMRTLFPLDKSVSCGVEREA